MRIKQHNFELIFDLLQSSNKSIEKKAFRIGMFSFYQLKIVTK
jgi:hypothetical protein